MDMPIGITRTAIIQDLIRSWDPRDQQRIRFYCLHAIVGGDPDYPVVTCERGNGKPIPLALMLRP